MQRGLELVVAMLSVGCGSPEALPADFLRTCSGPLGCEAGACIVEEGASAGFCSARCSGEQDCPAGWACTVYDSESFACQCPGGGCPGLPERAGPTDQVDVLLVIDDSNSMAEEQASFTRELPGFLRALQEQVGSVHVGVVSTDMGSGGYPLPTCDRGTFGAAYGDDGVLLTRGRTALGGCVATYPAVLAFGAGDDASTIGYDLACVATVGTGGCGFEQQLEAALKALSPARATAWTTDGYVPPSFAQGTSGHADGLNAGLVRDGSVLAVVVLTDEEDCSVLDPGVFDLTSPVYGGTDMNLRCFTYPGVAHPVARYVDGGDGHAGLLGLRRFRSRVVFAAIAGVPADALATPGSRDYQAMLDHPLMQERVDPSAPHLIPSCNSASGIAFPPRRIVETARGIEQAGGHTTVQSICDDDLRPALDEIVAEIASAAGGR